MRVRTRCTGERDDALDGLAGTLDQAAEAEQGLVGPSQIEWLDRVRDDLHNYRCALTWLIERGRSAEAADIGGGSCSSGSFVATRPKACGVTNRP